EAAGTPAIRLDSGPAQLSAVDRLETELHRAAPGQLDRVGVGECSRNTCAPQPREPEAPPGNPGDRPGRAWRVVEIEHVLPAAQRCCRQVELHGGLLGR